jgi:hypothetical protein
MRPSIGSYVSVSNRSVLAASFVSEVLLEPAVTSFRVAGVFMDDPEQGGNRHAAVAGLAIAVVLLAVGIWLAHELSAASKLQDCLMSGRTNCAVIPAQ